MTVEIDMDFVREEYCERGRTKRDVARSVGVSVTTLMKRMRECGIPNNPAHTYRGKDLTGMRFGRLMVVRRGKGDGHSKSRWSCRCDCGSSVLVNSSSLLRGLTKSCSCLKAERCRKGFMDISKSYYTKLRRGAVRRGLQFGIDIEDIWSQYEAQGGLCALTGREIRFWPNMDRPEHQTASVDRIDNDRGYTTDNIQIVHKEANAARGKMPVDAFVGLCGEVWKARGRYEGR